MEIVVNHLTRMSPGRICVAGVDVATCSHVRPVLDVALPTEMLERNGGPFDVGNIVDLGNVAHLPQQPKFEDHLFEQASARKIDVIAADLFWQLLTTVSEEDLDCIFGEHLIITDSRKAYLAEQTGTASLGCLVPLAPPEIVLDWEKLRVRVTTKFAGSVVSLLLSPTDIRLYQADHKTPRMEVIEDLNRRMASEEVVLAVGVGYPKQFGQYPSAHWLQVNGFHLSDCPVWQLQ